MAVRQIVASDLSGADIPEDQHARIQIKHPDYTSLLEIDATTEEAEKFQNTALRLVTLTIYAPNVPPREVVVETKIIDKIFPKFEDALQSARKADQSAVPQRRTRGAGKAASAPKSGEKIDYTAPDRYGQLHRGRITDEEARLVRENRDQASRNREAQTGSPINWEDPKEAKRYGL